MARDDAYREAEDVVAKARRSGAKSLSIVLPDLTEFPESLCRLTQLRRLELSCTQLRTLPESLGQLTELLWLNLSDNQLTTLPKSLGRLPRLQSLNLSLNQLTDLPATFQNLSKLESLELSSNRLTKLPYALRGLQQLKDLAVDGNQITMLPNWLGKLNLEILYVSGLQIGNPIGRLNPRIRELRNLRTLQANQCRLRELPTWINDLRTLEILSVEDNELMNLPTSLVELDNLHHLSLIGNPLNPDLAAAYAEGLDAVKRYLREMAKGERKRFEAKLLILGDGNVGKTCVSRALRELPFRKQQKTRGVDVEQWIIPHPDHPKERDKAITLNIWDFEGQEISHQTHQFFLTSYSLYLLVFGSRDQFRMDRAEYWLDTIRARAPKAKVAIVMTQCDRQTPHIPLNMLQAQYGDLLAKEWFFAVDCKTGLCINELQEFLKRWAADLEFMGSPWPASYNKAEKKIRAKKKTSHIGRDALDAIFEKSGISKESYDDAAAAMARLGVITQFPDCIDLRSFVVLRPQWLTKAISLVMDDKKLADDKGEITLKRMEEIWNAADYTGMFVTFHNCMKEFELCYDLEGQSQSCLLPLRFDAMPLEAPWSTGQDRKERRVEYKLTIRPPKGIMSRFIVKTHHMMVTTPEHPKGTYWHNGVFLRTGEGPLCSEALCKFIEEDRKLCIEVRAAFPQNLSEQIHAYVKAVFSFFSGLEAELSYGCINIDPKTNTERRCIGMHTEKRIFSEIKNRGMFHCEHGWHPVDPNKLIWGFSSFGNEDFVKAIAAQVTVDMRVELDKKPEWAAPLAENIVTLLSWTTENQGILNQLLGQQANILPELKQQAELKLHEYLGFMSDMLDDRDHTAAPALISITRKDRSVWNPAAYFKNTYVLTPYCENEQRIHACDDGKVEFTKNQAWWEKTAPWIARGVKVLAAGLQLAFAGMPMALGTPVADVVKNEVKFMEALTKQMELKAPEKDKSSKIDDVVNQHAMNLQAPDPEAALIRAALQRLLEETAPDNYRARRWGSLRRVRMSDNTYRWLCDECAKRIR